MPINCSICLGLVSNTYNNYYVGTLICDVCYKGARNIIALTNNNPIASSSSNKGLSSAVKWVNERKEMEEELKEKIRYLSGFAAAFKDQILTDIQVLPGNNQPPIPAHRALLAARSEIFRNALAADECKAPANQTIMMAEMNHEEVDALLEFLYSGSLAKEKVEKHVSSLLIAAHKYDIPYLQKVCEHQMLGSLSSSNALDILEIADICPNQNMKEKCINFILTNMEDIVFSEIFDPFVLKNPHLAVQITRASFTDSRKRKNTAV